MTGELIIMTTLVAQLAAGAIGLAVGATILWARHRRQMRQLDQQLLAELDCIDAEFEALQRREK